MKSLILAEKPSVGRDIARVLECHKKNNGSFENGRYIVTWALGHLVTLADPEKYGDHYKTWKLEDLPIIPGDLDLTVIKQTGKQYSIVKSLMHRKDVKDIVIATDAGREGELVARWIIEKAKIHKPIKRLWISSVTDKAIKQGFANLKNGKDYENLYYSAVARAEADWLVGINATRALTTKYNAQLSCGRVQTPTLAIIAKRDEEIKSFKPMEYIELYAMTDVVNVRWHDRKTNESRIFDKEKARKLIQSLTKQEGKVIDVRSSEKKNYAPQLYDLTELQRDANKRFGYSAKETLNILQKLYEQHKLVTYPRTDSRYLSTDIIETLKDRIEACMTPEYRKIGGKILTGGIKTNKSFIDNSKVTDHHALIPTEERVNIRSLSDKESKIYDLIVRRFLGVFLPPYIFEQKVVQVSIGDELFSTKGKAVLSLGWREIFSSVDGDDDEGEEQVPATIEPGMKVKVTEIKEMKKQTQPPKPFTEGTLLSAMENPTKYMAGESKDLIETIGKTGGLGTVATRADIIEKLFNSFLIEKKGKDITITNKGKQLLELVPDEIRSPVLSAEWEQKLERISKGQLKKQEFISDIKGYTKAVVTEIKESTTRFKHDNITGTKCPDCGKLMLEVNGKKGKMLVCQDRDCGNRKNISKLTNARCPNCHKKLEMRGEGEGQLFVCKCGHREKLSTFNERRQKNKNGKVSKRDVSKYLKNQEKEEPINTALADALAKLKFDK